MVEAGAQRERGEWGCDGIGGVVTGAKQIALRESVVRSGRVMHPPLASSRVLVGIGDGQLRHQVVSSLGRLGTEVVAAADGFKVVEAIADAILLSTSPRPDLIVVDSVLVGCSGLSLVGGLRDLGWDTPVILLVPEDGNQIRERAWSAGATGVFMKPFDAGSLGAFAKLLLETGPASGVRAHG